MGKTIILSLVLAGCAADSQPPSPTPREFFEHDVHPVLVQSCGGNTSGCHGSGGATPLLLDGADTAYDALVPLYTGEFTDTSSVLPLPHAGGVYSPYIHQQVEEWFARERER